ncbi:ferrochelatase [Marisediminicola sp. LYQ134]|uniref:ferrochelatase n=1 Tax=unclassified Marisediminicola TaxID=2618316 RepID=UPI0039832FE5
MTIAPDHAPSEQFVRAATPAAAAGPEHVTEPTAYDAILLASFGGPEGQDDVIPFLRNVTRGRGIPDERLEEVAHHYRHFGGVSPINDQNRELKAALEAELERRGIDLPVLWGNRNWDPYLKDALVEANERGYRKLIAVGTSAYSSYSSCRQYREDYAAALADTGLEGVIEIDKVRQFFDHPGFVQPFIDGLRDGLAQTSAAGIPLDQTHVLFTTHSIPSTDAAKSGPQSRGFGEGGAYAAQHLAVAEVVVAAQTPDAAASEPVEGAATALANAQLPGATSVPDAAEDVLAATAGTIAWSLVYQSRSGPPTQPWLEPDINDAIDDLAVAGIRAVVIVPIGFVSDHMEVKWDLDTEAMETSQKHGILAVRVPTPGVHAAYVSGLIDLVIERRDATPKDERPSLTPLGPWYDVCRPGCCENVRLGFKPTVAGLQP